MPEQIEALVKPELLTWARDAAGLSVLDAAHRLQVTPQRLEQWERGERRPTINQLSKLADAYKRPLGVFFLPHPPTQETAPPDFRRFHTPSSAVLSPDLRLAIRKAHQKRETALELFNDLGQKPPVFSLKAQLGQDPEETAAGLRHALGVGTNLTAGDAREHFNHWRSALEAAGVLVFQAEKIEVEEMRGFSITNQPLPVVVVNIKDAFSARNFSLFHETAHILLGRSGLCNFEEDEDSSQQRLETFCNRVAGAMLVPAEKLLGLPQTPQRAVSELPDTVTEDIARLFGVSQEVILRRLVILHRLPLPFYLKKREELRKRYGARSQPKSGFAPPSTMAVATNGRLFTRLILDAYSEEKIGTSDVLEFLGVRAKHLDKIRKAIRESAPGESVES
jgi:Zn-dependent peptidase ImmA (M78 family)/transcriptional regulator with XRE-family HTH domain